MSKTWISGAVFAALALFFSCKKEATPLTYDCTGIAPTYSTGIQSVLDTKCATSGCHSASSRSGGIDLSNYASAKSESASNAFLGSIERLSGYKSMPQGAAQLPDSTIRKISCWVSNGALP